MFGLGAGELIALAIIFILLFGSRKLPELAQGIGDAIKHIRYAFADEETKIRDKK